MTSLVLLRRTSVLLQYLGIGFGLLWGALVMSWARHRPLQPDAQHTHPYNDHGLIYVTTADLHLSHVFMALAALMGVTGLALYALGKRLYGGAFDPWAPRQ